MRTVMVGVLMAGLLTGCASTQHNQSMNSLQMRVNELEGQLAGKNDQIKDLEYEVKDLSYEIDRLKTKPRSSVSEPRSGSASVSKDDGNIIRVNGVSVDQVQTALKSAGYYDGAIDGKLGKRTKAAISDFQKAKGLKVDGIIGRQTWEYLQKQ